MTSRVAAALAMLCLPYLSLAAWLAASARLASIAPFVASVVLIGGLLAVVAGAGGTRVTPDE